MTCPQLQKSKVHRKMMFGCSRQERKRRSGAQSIKQFSKYECLFFITSFWKGSVLFWVGKSAQNQQVLVLELPKISY